MDGKISEQKVYCKIYCKISAQLVFALKEIHVALQKVYGNGALKYKWVRRLMMVRSQLKMTLELVGRFPF
jgi:hypothetical protein